MEKIVFKTLSHDIHFLTAFSISALISKKYLRQLYITNIQEVRIEVSVKLN